MQHSDGFCRVKQRQNESGVLRGGKFFCGLSLTEVVGLTVITNHFLWLCSKWTRPHLVDEFEPIHKINGIYKKNTTACRMRQEGFEKFIEVKQEKYDTSCSFRKKYAMWIRTNPFSVCGRSFYCRQQQDVAFLTIVQQSMQKNAGEKPLRWLGKTNSRSKNSTPTGRCQAETDKFTGTKFFRCGKRFASSMPQGKLQ